MKDTKIVYYQPHPLLKPFILHYICLKDAAQDYSKMVTLFPSNYPILCFDKERKHFKSSEGKIFNFSACFLGVNNTGNHFEKLADEVIQIVFKPFGVFNIFGIPQHPLANSIVDASGIFQQIAELTKELESEIHNSLSCVQKIERWLLKNVSSPISTYTRPVMLACEKIEESYGTAPIKSLYKMVGMSERSFRNHFTEQIGISPKTFSRIARFNKINALLAAETYAPDWQDLAYKFGFFDQTHFINECKWFYGNTPTYLWKNQPKNLNSLIFNLS